MKISVIVPVYNSSRILLDSYRNIRKELEKITDDYEIIFRNDGSKDESQGILEKISAENEKVRFSFNPINRGLGYTLKELFKDARGEFIIYLDADAYLCFNLTVLGDLLRMINGSTDVIIASRYSKKDNRIPAYRRYPSKVYNITNRVLFGVNIGDIGSGFVLFRKRALEDLNLEAEGFDIHIELFSRITRAGFKIKEVPVSYRHWDGGSFRLLKHAPRAMLGTLKAWFKIVVLNK